MKNDPDTECEVPAGSMPVEGKSQARRVGAVACTSAISVCGCSRCVLYRWYPPLLVISTVMAGVFCLLYLTKPVRLVAPEEQGEPAVPVAAPERVAPGEKPEQRYEQMVELSDASLNPLKGGLPGDDPNADLPQGETGSPVGFGSSGSGLKPLQVPGPRRELFVRRQVKREPDLEESGALVEVGENASPMAPQAGNEGGLKVVVPAAAHSELVSALAFEGHGMHSMMQEEEAPSDASDEIGLEVLMGNRGVPSAGGEGRRTLPRPAPSMIGEFYPERTKSEHRAAEGAST